MPIPRMVPEILVANGWKWDLKINRPKFLTKEDYDGASSGWTLAHWNMGDCLGHLSEEQLLLHHKYFRSAPRQFVQRTFRTKVKKTDISYRTIGTKIKPDISYTRHLVQKWVTPTQNLRLNLKNFKHYNPAVTALKASNLNSAVWVRIFIFCCMNRHGVYSYSRKWKFGPIQQNSNY